MKREGKWAMLRAVPQLCWGKLLAELRVGPKPPEVRLGTQATRLCFLLWSVFPPWTSCAHSEFPMYHIQLNKTVFLLSYTRTRTSFSSPHLSQPRGLLPALGSPCSRTSWIGVVRTSKKEEVLRGLLGDLHSTANILWLVLRDAGSQLLGHPPTPANSEWMAITHFPAR